MKILQALLKDIASKMTLSASLLHGSLFDKSIRTICRPTERKSRKMSNLTCCMHCVTSEAVKLKTEHDEFVAVMHGILSKYWLSLTTDTIEISIIILVATFST